MMLDVQSIKDTLSIVKGVLFDAEEKKDHKHGLREWRKQVVKMKVGHFFSSSNSLVFRLRMARQIKHVRRRLDKIADDGNKFGLERIDVNRTLVQRRDLTYSYFDASWVIGRDNDNDKIIKLLMQPHAHGDGDGDKSVCYSHSGYWRLGEDHTCKINIKIINSDSATALALTSAPSHQENVSSLGSQFSSLEVLYVQSCGNLESLLLHILPKPEALLVMRCEKLNLSLGYGSQIQRSRMKYLHFEQCLRQETLCRRCSF
ncbi:hypothetical protein glysoja_012666 [Glycine soja]|nr:hypothetical protein glysoja_012666 [Glycine soja]